MLQRVFLIVFLLENISKIVNVREWGGEGLGLKGLGWAGPSP